MSRALSYLTCATALLLATASCHDATTPLQRREQSIYAIQVPQRAAVGDTVRIGFHNGSGPCDAGIVFESQLIADGIRFVVSSVPTAADCLPPGVGEIAQLPFLYVVGPPHVAPFTVRFAEPGEADSVRVVAGP
ncbi:MAG: hypothetical protein M3Z54_01280 [Gemmatimonadota bacterium]|nr:hypothetical protein [Gemmatimonadota bacterium]